MIISDSVNTRVFGLPAIQGSRAPILTTHAHIALLFGSSSLRFGSVDDSECETSSALWAFLSFFQFAKLDAILGVCAVCIKLDVSI
jgi:hypothetical protein